MRRLGRGLRTVWADWGLKRLVPFAVKLRLRAAVRSLIRSRRRARLVLARRSGMPAHSPLYPAPPLRQGAGRMAVTHVLLASDLNERYLDFWPLTRRAWLEIAGLEPLLVLVAAEDEVPPALRADERVRVFTPVEGVHTAFQAQCIRLLYPALLETEGAVLISDIDLIPMNRRYWHDSVAAIEGTFFVAYRDTMHARDMVAIAYNAAAPATWSEIFKARSLADVRERLREWAEPVAYDGVRGGSGWFTDQVILHDTLLPWGERTRRLWFLDDDFTRFHRLEREELARGVTRRLRRRIRAGWYGDFHALVPNSEHRELNEEVVRLAAERTTST